MALSNEFRIKFHWNSKNSNLVYNLLFNDIKEVSGNCMLLGISNTNLYKQFLEDHQYEIDNLYIVDDEAMKWYVKSLEKYDVKIYFININKFIKEKSMPKFDYIIQNPPYGKNDFYLKFIDKCYDMLSSNGIMVCISPSNYLINLRNSRTKIKYNKIKDKINDSVYKINIQNFAKEFNIGIEVPIAIIYLQKNKKCINKEFICSNEKQIVNSIYDCNLICNYNIFQSIFNKIIKVHGNDVVQNHLAKKFEKNKYYVRVSNKLTLHPDNDTDTYFDKNIKINDRPLQFRYRYIQSLIHKNENNIFTFDKLDIKNTYLEFNTYEEAENYINCVYNSNICKFLCFALFTDSNGHNFRNVFPFIINIYNYDKYNFSIEEINIIENTIYKFDRYNKWNRKLFYD